MQNMLTKWESTPKTPQKAWRLRAAEWETPRNYTPKTRHAARNSDRKTNCRTPRIANELMILHKLRKYHKGNYHYAHGHA